MPLETVCDWATSSDGESHSGNPFR